MTHPTTQQDEAATVEQLAAHITRSPRARRALLALLHDGLVWREDIDKAAGVSNGPDEIKRLRDIGLEIPCQRVACKDSDGRPTHPGRYWLTANDRHLVWLALAQVKGGAA